MRRVFITALAFLAALATGGAPCAGEFDLVAITARIGMRLMEASRLTNDGVYIAGKDVVFEQGFSEYDPVRHTMTLSARVCHAGDAGFQVHAALGPGLLESAYEHCLAHELATRRPDKATGSNADYICRHGA